MESLKSLVSKIIDNKPTWFWSSKEKPRINKVNIENIRQNHPELIVRDFAEFINPEVMRHVRRLLIQLKDRWKKQITYLQAEAYAAKKRRQWVLYHRYAGAVEMLKDCRQQVRALCHSNRDVNFPRSISWGNNCKLTDDFPDRPNKNFLKGKKSIKEKNMSEIKICTKCKSEMCLDDRSLGSLEEQNDDKECDIPNKQMVCTTCWTYAYI
jgi:hypothetical protein